MFTYRKLSFTLPNINKYLYIFLKILITEEQFATQYGGISSTKNGAIEEGLHCKHTKLLHLAQLASNPERQMRAY